MKYVLIIGAILLVLFIIIVVVLYVKDHKSDKEHSPRPSYQEIVNQRIGDYGEYQVKEILESIPNARVINNMYFRIHDDFTVQLDHVLICKQGVFVIEDKKWAGEIIDDRYDEYWIHRIGYENIQEFKKKNPIRQNENHIKDLSRKLDVDINIKGLVVFVNDNKPDIFDGDIVNLSDLTRRISSLEDELYQDEVEEIFNEILKINDPSISPEEHIENIKRHHQN